MQLWDRELCLGSMCPTPSTPSHPTLPDNTTKSKEAISSSPPPRRLVPGIVWTGTLLSTHMHTYTFLGTKCNCPPNSRMCHFSARLAACSSMGFKLNALFSVHHCFPGKTSCCVKGEAPEAEHYAGCQWIKWQHLEHRSHPTQDEAMVSGSKTCPPALLCVLTADLPCFSTQARS